MKRVLLPYDFSPHSRRALALALSGVPFGPEVTIDALHVVDPRLYARLPSDKSPPSRAALESHFRDEVTRATTPKRRVAEIPALLIAEGHPGREILARVGDYGGIILGGQGHGGLRERFLGTTAMRVVRLAPVSVHVVKNTRSLAAPARLLAAVDGDDCSRRALVEAYALSRMCEASLHLTRTIVESPFYGPWSEVSVHNDDKAAYDEAREALIAFEVETLHGAFAQRHDVQFSRGGVAADIVHRATVDRIDIIVVGAHDDSLAKSLLGSVSEGVVQQAECDVLVVR